MCQVALGLLNILLDLLNLVIGLIRIITRNSDELQLRQALNIFDRNLALELLLEGLQTAVHSLICLLARLTSLDKLVELILDEDALE